ncbi:MAG: serine O-acetyltransferase [Neisseriaceae bacterium]|nr:MAG: serine O-acetyltransferase [Neisseriaceae bacterium]
MNNAYDKQKIYGQDLWENILSEVEQAVLDEPILAGFLHLTVLRSSNLAEVLAFHLSSRLSSQIMDPRALNEIFLDCFRENKEIINAVEEDILAYYQRDPACDQYSMPLLYYKGFHAIQTHRINQWLWKNNHRTLALFLQNRSSEVFGVDIHPGATIGQGIMSDHGTGLVIGETAVLGNDISLLHGVTLGGSGKETGDRHPKVRDGVMIGANASILGNIIIGEWSRIGAGSVVTRNVPPHVTVVGVPARIIDSTDNNMPSKEMNQILDYDMDFVI